MKTTNCKTRRESPKQVISASCDVKLYLVLIERAAYMVFYGNTLLWFSLFILSLLLSWLLCNPLLHNTSQTKHARKNIFPCFLHNFHHSNLNMTSRFENFIVNMQTLSDVYNFQTPPEYQNSCCKTRSSLRCKLPGTDLMTGLGNALK